MSHAELLLTALQPIAHHDPDAEKGSNIVTFNRKKQKIQRSPGDEPIYQDTVDAFCERNRLPQMIFDATKHLTFPQFVAVALTRTLIDIYNSQEGAGLFSGMDRYEMLDKRLNAAAIKTSTLYGFWSAVLRGLHLPIHPSHQDETLLLFWSLPRSVQVQAIASLVEQSQSVVALARLWSSHAKLHDADYATKAGNLLSVDQPLLVPHFPLEGMTSANPWMVVEVPHISANTIRHQVVRAPAWQHLCRLLNLPASHPGQGPLPPSVEAIFVNGGNLLTGAKQPGRAFALGGLMRESYPSLDLLGGVADAFDLGESHLKVSAWLVCRENADALPDELRHRPEAQISIFDMLDDVTETRQATRNGVGQMIRTFETLVKGTQIYVRLALSPYTQPLAEGALLAAIHEYMDNQSIVAGQSARGYGLVRAELLHSDIEDRYRHEYEFYLRENAESLRAELYNGQLGTGVRVLS